MSEKAKTPAGIVAAGILPAVEPGFQPGGSGVENSEAMEKSSIEPGGKMPPSTAGRMPAATFFRHAFTLRETHVASIVIRKS
jgi:hypothetical protein